MLLCDLPLKISYTSKGDDNIAEAFLNPALKCSCLYKRSVGFFSSSVFEVIESGLQDFLNNNGEIQIICSPELSEEDIESIKTGYKLKENVLRQCIEEDVEYLSERISDEDLSLLSKLIKDGRLNVKVVDVCSSQSGYGMYHDKIGILEDKESNKVLFIGSPNESRNAYMDNYEKVRISRSWVEGENAHLKDDEDEFDHIWDGTNPYVKRYDCGDLVARKIENVLKVRGAKTSGVNLRDYQKEAIAAWENNGRHGFFVMATGTGKTWTAIYSALNVIKEESVFLVICAPYKHLVKQWYYDVHKVLPDCSITMVSSENSNWQNELIDALYDSRLISHRSVIAISTIKSFNSDKFGKIAESCKMKRMLIVDEAHRFKNLSEDIQNKYSYMLGLSATPASRKNDEFADQLVDFFGGKVYDLPIEFAIEKKYLVKYNYHPIYVSATREDEEKFNYYSGLMSGCFKNGVCKDPEKLAKYKRARLRVISMAQEKNERLEWILSQIKEDNHFIVYCGDGRLFDSDNVEGLRHIQFVKNALTDKGYRVCQFTASESMDERMKIVETFNKGIIDAMVAIRCLDEGINIPSIEGALLLSSNDDYREFVQRRGRILRTYENEYTGKEKKIANIYDVIVLPNTEAHSFATIELRRFYEYARLALNSDSCLRELEDYMLQYGIGYEEFDNVEDVEEELDE